MIVRRNMKLMCSYLKQRRREILISMLFDLIFIVIFALYHLPLQAVLYPAGLCALLGILFLAVDFQRVSQRHKQLLKIREFMDVVKGAMPQAGSVEAEDYQQIICLLCEEQKRLEMQMNAHYMDMVDYYTVWAHQIKTPIASMKLRLQNEDSALSRKVSSDLFRIEQYVEMVLMFLRLDDGASDYLIREYSLDDIVKQAVRKFAGEFIGRKLSLEYEPPDVTVITDEKWLLFVVEQVLSNALKYTQSGGISIFVEEPKTLCIRDTGIGIAPEDLPRIFEKGYTGYNGRSDKKASGIGLYLCRRICQNLGHTISAESVPDEGTTIRLDLEQQDVKTE